MKSTPTTWLSKLKVISGALSTVLMAGSFAVAQNDFDFSSLPSQQQQQAAQQGTNQTQSQARIITGQNSLRQLQDSGFGQPSPLRTAQQPQQNLHSASSVSSNMTESQSTFQRTSHMASNTIPTRLYRLANCCLLYTSDAADE